MKHTQQNWNIMQTQCNHEQRKISLVKMKTHSKFPKPSNMNSLKVKASLTQRSRVTGEALEDELLLSLEGFVKCGVRELEDICLVSLQIQRVCLMRWEFAYPK
eukprot:g6655.t1